MHGLSGRALPSKVYCKMSKTPQRLKSYYEASIKYSKTDSTEGKHEFLQSFLSDEGWSTTYVERLQKDTHTDSGKTSSECMSWKALSAVGGEAVLTHAISTGRIDTRPHPLLDLNDPKVMNWPARLKLQYTWVNNSDDAL